MDARNRSLKDEGLSHPPGKPPRPAKALFVGEGNLEGSIGVRGENDISCSPRQSAMFTAIVHPFNLPLVSVS